MKIGAIVQARLSSQRLPKKVILPLAGKPILWHVLNRLGYAKRLDTVVLATTTLAEDKVLARVADGFSISTFFGSLDDVLSRYYQAAKEYKIDSIVRITADCPMIDPEIVDEVTEEFIKGAYDHYGLVGASPDGLDVTVLSFKALSIAFNEAELPSEREHVGGEFFKKHSDRFKIGGLEKFKDKANYRWTIDEPEDYEFLKIVFEELYSPGHPFSYRDIFKLLERKPEIQKINSHIIRNEGYLKSLKKDRQFIAKRKN